MIFFDDVIDDVIIFWDYCSDPNYQFFWLWCNGFIEPVAHQLWLIYTSINLFYIYWSKIFILWCHNQRFYENTYFKLFFCEFSYASNLKLFFLDESTITYLLEYIFDVYKPYKDQKYRINQHNCVKTVKNAIKWGIFHYFINISSVFLLKNVGEAAW